MSTAAGHRVHRPVPQQFHILDAVRPGDHPGHQAADLDLALTPHGPPGLTRCATSSPNPARCASATTGARSACDTRFGSSNVAWIFARSCNNRTYNVSS